MTDKYLWLEDVVADKSIKWVKEKNNESINKLKGHLLFAEIEQNALEFLGTKDKIPYIEIHGEHVYNLWNDDIHIQGIYRRTSLSEYLKNSPLWETILDLDKLSVSDNEKWILRGFELNDDVSRALVFLSPGGSDANIMREYNMQTYTFVTNGFFLPESKGYAQ
ncbi:MAG: hypothetical protein Q7U04_13355, partial [Bacteriovorax sp.]|nr:hypothetical protein [Bacteriovorax sp.]